MRKIVLATVGTIGDLHPFLALALALQTRGFRPVLAVPEDHLSKASATGIEAVAVLPGFEEVCARMGLGEREAASRIISDQRQMFEQVVLPSLSSCAAKLDRLTSDSEAIVASTFVLAAPMIAEKRRLPLVSVVLQPMALLSALDPPQTPDFWMMKGTPVGPVGAAWNRGVYAILHRVMHRLYGRTIYAVRADHGLPPTGGKRIFKPGRSTVLTLGCYSRLFAPLPPDPPQNTQLVGFPLFDSESGADNALDPALEAFLAAGPSPLVFTLGTFATHAAGDFYAEAAKTSRQLGVRAVLLTGTASRVQSDPSIFQCAYAPYSRVFPHAAAIVHHGGIGTTGQALLAGKPQLVVPHMGDQNDHAHRIVRLGTGFSLNPAQFSADRAAPLLEVLLHGEGLRAQAARMGALISMEDGAAVASAAIERELDPGERRSRALV